MKQEFKVISQLIEEKSRALDVGCGDGELIEFLLKNKTNHIRGLEIFSPFSDNDLKILIFLFLQKL